MKFFKNGHNYLDYKKRSDITTLKLTKKSYGSRKTRKVRKIKYSGKKRLFLKGRVRKYFTQDSKQREVQKNKKL